MRSNWTFLEALAYTDRHPQYAVRDKRRHRYKRFGKHVYKLEWRKRVWRRWRNRSDRENLSRRYGPFRLEHVQIPFYLLHKIIFNWTAEKAHFGQKFRGSFVRVTAFDEDVVVTYKGMSLTLKRDIDPEEAIEELSYLLDLIRRRSFGFNFYRKKNLLTPL